jgi:hypothetical protein
LNITQTYLSPHAAVLSGFIFPSNVLKNRLSEFQLVTNMRMNDSADQGLQVEGVSSFLFAGSCNRNLAATSSAFMKFVGIVS